MLTPLSPAPLEGVGDPSISYGGGAHAYVRTLRCLRDNLYKLITYIHINYVLL